MKLYMSLYLVLYSVLYDYWPVYLCDRTQKGYECNSQGSQER